MPAQGPAPLAGVAIALVIFIMFSWGMNQVAMKISNRGFNPMLMASGRSILGGGLVFLWCYYKRIALFRRDGTLWAGIAAGALFGTEFVLIFLAMELTTVGRVTLMMNVMPFWVAIGGHFLLGERMKLHTFIGMCVAFVGVYLVLSDDVSRTGPHAHWGDMLALLSGVLWGLTSLVIKKSNLRTAPPEKTLLYQLAMASVIPLPFIAANGPLIRNPDFLSIAAFVFQSAFVVAFTYPLWFWMVRRYPISALSNFAFLTPAFGVLLSGLILQEPLGWKIFAALLLIGLGLAITNHAPRKKDAA